MNIIKHLLFTFIALFMLFVLTRTFKHPLKEYYGSTDSYVYSKGNASDSVRAEIIDLLNAFQRGYTERDTAQVEAFIRELFAEDNLLILGTMPHEICIGRKGVSRLIFADWYRWGDCTFLMDNANISVNGNTAWISTIGYVDMDLSSLLVLPLRLTATIIQDQSAWKFQQMQFQFDLDLTFALITTILLIIWSIIAMIQLVFVTSKRLNNARN